MPRRKPPLKSESETPLPPVVIHETGVYSAGQVKQMLGLRQTSLRREIREGRLAVIKRCGRYFFLGEQLLAWLRAGERRRPPAA
jgi:hypothetical protein